VEYRGLRAISHVLIYSGNTRMINKILITCLVRESLLFSKIANFVFQYKLLNDILIANDMRNLRHGPRRTLNSVLENLITVIMQMKFKFYREVSCFSQIVAFLDRYNAICVSFPSRIDVLLLKCHSGNGNSVDVFVYDYSYFSNMKLLKLFLRKQSPRCFCSVFLFHLCTY